MGKHRRQRRPDLGKSMDQHLVGDGPRIAELGSISERGELPAGGANRNDPLAIVSPDDRLPLDQRDVRRGVKRLRVPRGATHALARTFDAFELDVIFNAPDVFPAITTTGIERISTANLLSDPRNVGMIIEGGAFMFTQIEPGIYETNCSFLTEYRGAYAKSAIKQAIAWMFTHSDAVTLFCRIPLCNAAALIAVKLVGGRNIANRPGAWPKDGEVYGASIYQLTLDEWFKAGRSSVLGLTVMADLESARKSMLGEADDLINGMATPSLARHVGFAFEMIFAGQFDKGVLWFNHYAKMALWPPMGLIAREPAMIVAFGVLLQITGDSFKAIKAS